MGKAITQGKKKPAKKKAAAKKGTKKKTVPKSPGKAPEIFEEGQQAWERGESVPCGD